MLKIKSLNKKLVKRKKKYQIAEYGRFITRI